MSIVVDQKGWVLVGEPALESTEPTEIADEPMLKPGSGVFAKVINPREDIGTQATEPSPASDEAMEAASVRLPCPPAIPQDLVGGSGSRVA